jgi:hypothetical protein
VDQQRSKTRFEVDVMALLCIMTMVEVETKNRAVCTVPLLDLLYVNDSLERELVERVLHP